MAYSISDRVLEPIIGARTGQKDITGKCVMEPMPGLLRNLTGSSVREFTFIDPADEPQTMTWGAKQLSTGIFSDILDPDAADAEVLATYDRDYYQGSAALIKREYGKGKVLHFGGTFTFDNVVQFLRYTQALSPWEDLVCLPEDCEIAVRKKNHKQYLFILNYSWNAQKICLKKSVKDMDSGLAATGEVELPPFGTRVYEI